MPRAVDAALGAPLLGPEPMEPISGGQQADGGGAQPAPAAGVSRPVSPGLLDQEADSELQPGPEPEPRAGGHAEAGEPADGGAAPISRRNRALLALALSTALVSPIVVPIGLFQLFEWSAAGEVCPFVPINETAQKAIVDLIALPPEQRESALGNLDNGTVLQLLRDADNRLFSETWIASAPIALRNSFLAWLAAKLFFAATELQDRGLMGMAVAGHGARTSVVGDDTASAAGWLTAVWLAGR